MIKTQKLAPSNYYKESRDFQLFGRIYDVLFNYLKNNTLTINDITTNINPNQKILDLMCNTLGFKTKHEYNNDELSALCSIFLSCMKAKGSVKAIKLLLEMITSIENSLWTPKILYDYNGVGLTIMVPSDIKDWTLIRDVMDYIMPCGSSYMLVNQSLEESAAITSFSVQSSVESDSSWSVVSSAIIRNVKLNGEPETSIGNVYNYNIKEVNGDISTTKDTHINQNIETMNSQIVRIPDPTSLGKTVEQQQKDISKALGIATVDPEVEED